MDYSREAFERITNTSSYCLPSPDLTNRVSIPCLSFSLAKLKPEKRWTTNPIQKCLEKHILHSCLKRKTDNKFTFNELLVAVDEFVYDISSFDGLVISIWIHLKLSALAFQLRGLNDCLKRQTCFFFPSINFLFAPFHGAKPYSQLLIYSEIISTQFVLSRLGTFLVRLCQFLRCPVPGQWCKRVETVMHQLMTKWARLKGTF